MTGETKRLINSLQEKIASLQNRVKVLKGENASLVEKLTDKELEFDNQKVVLGELEQRYKALKFAKSLGGDNVEMKKRINAMVKEIDTCIELIEK